MKRPNIHRTRLQKLRILTEPFQTLTNGLLRESLEAVQQTAAVILRGIAPEPAAVTAAA